MAYMFVKQIHLHYYWISIKIVVTLKVYYIITLPTISLHIINSKTVLNLAFCIEAEAVIYCYKKKEYFDSRLVVNFFSQYSLSKIDND